MKGFLRDLKNLSDDYRAAYKRKNLLKGDLHKVRLSSHRGVYNDFIIDQTPNRAGIIGNTIYYNSIFSDFDFVINKPNLAINYKKEESFLLHIEPPSYINKLGLSSPQILDKFNKIYTSDPYLIEKNNDRYIASAPFVHWHLGSNSHICKVKDEYLIDYDFLLKTNYPKKTVNLSTINSNLMNVEGHKIRAEFLEKLCKTDYNFNLYGGNKWSKFRQYIDNAPNGKWFPFSQSRYILVIENERAPFYWSEKFSDALLCYGTPIYYGCTNISDYFPKGSYYPIDINRKDCIEEIISVVESDFHERNMPQLMKARDLIFEKYNMFSFMNKVINENL
ncbi:hypothetical protein ACFSKN_07555 [Mariniflexile gromovii]|uniref:Glycosyl transferase family 10 (Putative fucosyltransferase) n=1 Tax=Mariniflexile gromovii TaxID=362523 RepID=A0ABS4BRY8_9FLAO|nr:hypothetical protein [Mariniflexile gromovii]MBP0902860.1 hypothetical protein [Mariniflexile gromovii]